jgi:multisubunit Na+/H+ antiporter MnhB subunit
MTIMTRAIARMLLLPIFMVATAILVKGYAEVGDGFGAGIIATLGILLQYTALGSDEARTLPPVRVAPALGLTGLVIALLVAFVPVLRGDAIMTHSPPPGAAVIHLGTVEILTAVAFDIGVFLLVFGFAVGTIDLIAQTRDEASEQPPDQLLERRNREGGR